MNLNQIRLFVRTQLDLDETDLPDILLDTFVRDGYDHIINQERRWPFFESMWLLSTNTDGTATLPVDADVVESLMTEDGQRLWHVDMRWAEDNYGGSTTTGSPTYWSQLGRTIYLYPAPGDALALRARGYRMPTDWINQGASAEVDADIRLHIPVTYYACSMGYAQQEDEVLEQTYMNRFREATTLAKDAVMRSWTGSPKIMFGMHHGRRPLGLAILPPGPSVEKTSAIGGTP